jgi:hypothetical protein
MAAQSPVITYQAIGSSCDCIEIQLTVSENTVYTVIWILLMAGYLPRSASWDQIILLMSLLSMSELLT